MEARVKPPIAKTFDLWNHPFYNWHRLMEAIDLYEEGMHCIAQAQAASIIFNF